MNQEKEAFAKRLRQAMLDAGYDPRPSVLERLFNTHSWGASVTFQGASRWLNGKSIPTQDKLQVLAGLLAVEQQYLRFGEEAVKGVLEKRARWDAGLAPEDREIVELLLNLTVEQKKVVHEVIQAFAAKPASKNKR